MNKVIAGIIGLAIALLCLRGCLQSGRRATVYAIAKNKPDCVVSSVYVSDDGSYFAYTTKRGKIRCFTVEWSNGAPTVNEEPID